MQDNLKYQPVIISNLAQFVIHILLLHLSMMVTLTNIEQATNAFKGPMNPSGNYKMWPIKPSKMPASFEK